MKPENKKNIIYLAPACEVIELKLEGVIALSGLSDYEDGGVL